MKYAYLLYGRFGLEACYSSLAKAQHDVTGWTQADPTTWTALDRAGERWTIEKWALQ